MMDASTNAELSTDLLARVGRIAAEIGRFIELATTNVPAMSSVCLRDRELAQFAAGRMMFGLPPDAGRLA